MLVVNLKDQLGNQMFAYASVKSIAINKNLDFGCYRVLLDSKYINDTDEKFGHDLFTIFKLPSNELIKDQKSNMNIYREVPMKEREVPNYVRNVYNSISDNMIMDGHFITTAFFSDRLEDVRRWFALPETVCQTVKKRLEIISQNGKRPTVSVHFRVGNDYLKLGYRMHKSYWINAANYMRNALDDPIFVCVYDKKTRIVEEFMEEFESVDARGSLVEDMCLIANCNANIVCNSTFSIMSAILNENSIETVCPMKYPTQAGFMPSDVFLDDWKRVGSGRRDFVSGVCYLLHKINNRAKAFNGKKV